MASPRILTIPVGPLQCNCSILIDEKSREAVVIDPGDEAGLILDALERESARAVTLLHTHAHFDHVGATAEVAAATGASIRLHPADRPLYDRLPQQAAMFGLSAGPPTPVDQPLREGETISFGGLSVRVLHTPGHTPGSCSFLLEGERPVLFAGDTLFRRSIGRTDLWGGDTDQIFASIRGKLFELPSDTPVACGHGPATTIGEEKLANPFVGI
jgi:glyoxylase-like metal-dependent hydrolase (beta-lactamase superfamily II)